MAARSTRSIRQAVHAGLEHQAVHHGGGAGADRAGLPVQDHGRNRRRGGQVRPAGTATWCWWGAAIPTFRPRAALCRAAPSARSPPIRVLEQLADQLVQKGVKYIDGDIVADDSYYAFERYGEGWTQDDLVWESGAPVSALTINDNVMFVNILPADRPGEKAFVTIDAVSPTTTSIDNRIITTPAGTGPRKIYINREPGSNVLTLVGQHPGGRSRRRTKRWRSKIRRSSRRQLFRAIAGEARRRGLRQAAHPPHRTGQPADASRVTPWPRAAATTPRRRSHAAGAGQLPVAAADAKICRSSTRSARTCTPS